MIMVCWRSSDFRATLSPSLLPFLVSVRLGDGMPSLALVKSHSAASVYDSIVQVVCLGVGRRWPPDMTAVVAITIQPSRLHIMAMRRTPWRPSMAVSS